MSGVQVRPRPDDNSAQRAMDCASEDPRPHEMVIAHRGEERRVQQHDGHGKQAMAQPTQHPPETPRRPQDRSAFGEDVLAHSQAHCSLSVGRHLHALSRYQPGNSGCERIDLHRAQLPPARRRRGPAGCIWTCPTSRRTRPRRSVHGGIRRSSAGTTRGHRQPGWTGGPRCPTCPTYCRARTARSGPDCSST